MVERLSLLPAVGFLLIAGCAGSDTSSVLASWFDVQQKYAAALDEHLGQGNEKFRITPIRGAIYEPGTILVSGRADPWSVCTFPAADVRAVPMAPLPSIGIKTTVKASLGLPGTIQRAFRSLVSLGAKVEATDELTVAFLDLEQRYLLGATLEKRLNHPDCQSLDSLFGEPILIVRGYIRGKQITSSARKISAEADIKTLRQDGLVASWDNSGNYRIEDDRPHEWFFIVSKISVFRRPPVMAEKTASMDTAVIFYATPTDDDLDRLGRMETPPVKAPIRLSRGSLTDSL